MDQWQPIETLRGDDMEGMHVLLWRPVDKCVYAGYLDFGGGLRRFKPVTPYGQGDELSGITHWMPLPAAPAAVREGPSRQQ